MLYPAHERPVVTLADDDIDMPFVVVDEGLPEWCEVTCR
jgi:hypothetical protein